MGIMIIVPVDAQLNNNVAKEFFNTIFKSDIQGKQTVNAFLAISSFGNVVVWTYTAARMKQEIAKQGFIPFAKFFAKNKDFSLGRLLTWLEGRSWNFLGRGIRLLNPANHREKTPVGALLLHLISSVVLILATYNVPISDAYGILFRVFTYVIAAWFGLFLALGILILHFWGPPPTEPVQTPTHNDVPDQPIVQRSWNQMIKGTVNSKVAVVCAALYLCGSIYPIVLNWVPPAPSPKHLSVAWYVVPLISWCVLAVSAIWFLGFVAIAAYRSYMGRKEFVYVCELEFDQAEKTQQGMAGDEGLPAGEAASGTNRGGLILLHETIYMVWQAMETNTLYGRGAGNGDGSTATRQHGLSHERRQEAQEVPTSEFDNTDFARF
ncbi:hypothetical protein QQS21_000392 [Conoideocrella luteorostrata]|uniref:Uncharacterized protein n=1 Tax=Conoideocrella luteorostrata TaxID=1105319 RepID=A0AAJ0CYT0_9HYPO|nr:hypothetical protein QQS21_000392 [Conoideocrella luteorostrata]